MPSISGWGPRKVIRRMRCRTIPNSIALLNGYESVSVYALCTTDVGGGLVVTMSEGYYNVCKVSERRF